MSIVVTITGGPTAQVDWVRDMNAQQALEAAWRRLNAESAPKRVFTYELQYFGELGYLVVMINDTHETYSTTLEPNFFWEFYYGTNPATVGIDQQKLNDGDEIRFAYEPDDSTASSAWKDIKRTAGG